MVVFVHVDRRPAEVEETVCAWFRARLALLAPDLLGLVRFVYNVKDDEWRDGGACDTATNSFAFAVRFGESYAASLDVDRIVIVVEEHKPSVHPNVLLELLVHEPSCVTKLGVSGVSESMMQRAWTDIISKSPRGLDRAGRGPWNHTMWLHDGTGWFEDAERSCDFGWALSPPAHGLVW